MCRQPATGGVSPCVCVTACAQREKRRWRREERVYVGMQERIRGRRDRQAGRRSKVLLVILPLIQSPHTLKELHPLPLLQRWADACVCKQRGSLRIYGWERGAGEPKKRSPSVFCPREGSHTPQTAHTLHWALGTVSLTTRMGCNLCTLQKREEHYKLLYEIAQVRENLKEKREIWWE